MDAVRKEIVQIAKAETQEFVDVGGRPILLALSASWSVFSISPPVKAVLSSID
jgi:hypothetical protein